MDESDRQGTSISGRIKWTEKMNNDLIECKQQAKSEVSSENPPLKPDGKIKDYMLSMKGLWENKGYYQEEHKERINNTERLDKRRSI